MCVRHISLHIHSHSARVSIEKMDYKLIITVLLCSMCADQQMLYYPVFIVIFQFGWAAVQISHLSLITDLTSIGSLFSSDDSD